MVEDFWGVKSRGKKVDLGFHFPGKSKTGTILGLRHHETGMIGDHKETTFRSNRISIGT